MNVQKNIASFVSHVTNNKFKQANDALAAVTSKGNN